MFRGCIYKIVLVAILVAANTSFAQTTFVNLPGDTVKATIEPSAKKVIDIKQSAIGSDTLILAWQKVSVSLPNQWTASICDNGTCYNNLQDTGTMAALIPGDYGFLSLHIGASTTVGTAIIRYAVWDIKHSAQIDTLTWVVAAFSTGITNYSEFTPKVFSSNKKIYLSSVSNNPLSEINVYDMSGKLILCRKTITKDEVIDMSSCNDGIYIICMPNINLMKQVFIGY